MWVLLVGCSSRKQISYTVYLCWDSLFVRVSIFLSQNNKERVLVGVPRMLAHTRQVRRKEKLRWMVG